MAIIEASATINKSAEEIFAYITDLENQKKISSYVTAVEVQGPMQVGTKYKITTSSNGMNIDIMNEIVGYEPNRLFSVKTFAPPPASDMVNTTLLEAEGSGTKVTMQMDTNLVPAGMPSMPGMEDMMKGQMTKLLQDSLATLKKSMEG